MNSAGDPGTLSFIYKVDHCEDRVKRKNPSVFALRVPRTNVDGGPAQAGVSGFMLDSLHMQQLPSRNEGFISRCIRLLGLPTVKAHGQWLTHSYFVTVLVAGSPR